MCVVELPELLLINLSFKSFNFDLIIGISVTEAKFNPEMFIAVFEGNFEAINWLI